MITSQIKSNEIDFESCNKDLLEEIIFYGIGLGADFVEIFIENTDNASVLAEEDNIKSYYIDSIYNTIWQDGLNMNDQVIVKKKKKNLNVNPKTFILRSTSSLIKDSLRKKTNDAYEKGIFGAPSFSVENEIFWGDDRLEDAIECLRESEK